jgi:hypothetical protein
MRQTHDLGQIQRVAADGIKHQVLQLVDDAEEVLSQGRHRNGMVGAAEPLEVVGEGRNDLVVLSLLEFCVVRFW